MLPFFGSCIIHILNTGCAKILKENSGAKGLNWISQKQLAKMWITFEVLGAL